jgi:hypothetical protein
MGILRRPEGGVSSPAALHIMEREMSEFHVVLSYKGKSTTITLEDHTYGSLSRAVLSMYPEFQASQLRFVVKGKRLDHTSESTALPFASNSKIMFLPQALEETKASLTKEVVNVRVS